ncbi:DUF3934 family protein [Paenibacillus sp. JX-17]|uniref:DUF3934 family protein n=1 Tax=Paenibacillus lacisoli TaxID=3064525 RepID=A0ABT9CEA7_9BACL|nr:DUF3934 family protein [Paenibacillus sp. JX-17]MDO7907610.1 DUF3934 family protein [Paenibacillus sp. JX-17]
MSKSKGKGTGHGTGKKGWNRWQAGARRAKSAPKPYKSKGTKNPDNAPGNDSGNISGSKPD